MLQAKGKQKQTIKPDEEKKEVEFRGLAYAECSS
jgi:hypothetical protein